MHRFRSDCQVWSMLVSEPYALQDGSGMIVAYESVEMLKKNFLT